MNVATARSDAAEKLRIAGIPEYRREAASLLTFVLDRPHSFLIAHPESELSEDELDRFQDMVSRRQKREPFQYITGRQEFFGIEFNLTPDVLIPRPETEVLVEEAIRIISQIKDVRFCDIGTGSGCIAISILKSVAGGSGVAVDISSSALKVAKANAKKHDVADRLNLRCADAFDGVGGEFDLIVSNPPYIAVGDFDGLQIEVRDHEPILALVGGEDGLNVVRKIVDQASNHLVSNGTLLIEIGFDQSSTVVELFDTEIWHSPKTIQDLQGIQRVVSATLK